MICTSCGSDHMGIKPCGLTYAARLRSVRLDNSVTPSKSKRNYYDAETLHTLVPEHAQDQLMEETDGFGPVSQAELARYPELIPDISAYYAAGEVVDE